MLTTKQDMRNTRNLSDITELNDEDNIHSSR